MRNLKLSSLAALIALVAIACGPSNMELKTAKETRYKTDPQTLLLGVKAILEDKQYKIGKVDQTALVVTTLGRWYNPTGELVSENDDMRQVPDKSFNIIFVVTLVKDGDAFLISVTKKMLQNVAGRPNPDVLTDDDIRIPGWVQGKQDTVAFSLHDGLKPYAVAAPGGVAPAPSAPAAAPAAPAPAPAPAAPGQ